VITQAAGPTATATATAFEPSLFVWATVMSRPTEDRAIVDAGLKALAFDSGPPIVCDEPAATYERASDEHGRLAVAAATNRLALGDKIRLIPAHCDPTVNLYNWCVYVRASGVKHRPQRGVVMLVASPYPEAGPP
jgi:3-hydroxy-D-aspartate aldolase